MIHIGSDAAEKGSGSLIYKASGAGLLVTPRGVTLGWVDEKAAIIGDASRCQMIVWVESENGLEQIKDLIARRKIVSDKLCLISRGN